MSERILFVDNSQDALDVFERLLSSEFEVATAASGAAGLEACRTQGPFAVVVSDYDMPGMKGSEFLMRVHEEWPETVTMLLTGVVDLDVAIEALHAGRIFRFLEKPCPRETLRQALAAAVVEHQKNVTERERRDQLDFQSRVLTQFNGALEQRISEQTVALVRLHRYVSELNACDSLEEIARLTAASAREVCGERGAFVELWDGSTTGERCQALAGPELSVRRHAQPLVSPEGQIGSVVVDSLDPQGRKLSRSERSMLASIASSAAVAAHNQIRRRERDEAQQATILALAKLAEQRDNETGKHLERVSLYCKLIAEGLRKSGWYLDEINDGFERDLVRSAPLHDIGKVGIPDAILLKPGRLTPEEWAIMRRHTEIGAETLRSVMSGNRRQRFLEMSLEIAWAHHEKWDGTGYPRGLAGGAIPLAARIVALADVYDALTSVRPYKQAWTHEESMRWIVAGAGTHFDPRVVRVFVGREREAAAIAARLADTVEDLRHIGVQA